MENLLKVDEFRNIITKINKTLQDNAKYLSELDSTVGDGDHGTTISRGFKNVISEIEEQKPKTIEKLLRTTGMTLISTMGGVSGPIFGSIFTEWSKVSKGKKYIDLKDLYKMFLSAIEKIKKLGGAKKGDKTMIDSMHPALDNLRESLDKGLSIKDALKAASLAAKIGAESTRDMIAKKGRARYLGERSKGYQDAGATTMYLIIKAMYEAI